MSGSRSNERFEDVALRKRYKTLSDKLRIAKAPSESFWNLETSGPRRWPVAVRHIAKKARRFWSRRTFAELVFGPLVFFAIIILAGPFLWSLLLHGIHLAHESLTESPSEYLKEIAKLDNAEFFANVRNLGLIALGIVGTTLAVWRSVLAHQAHKLSEKGLIIDRFQKGAQMLESNELSVRLAGIYTLRELATSDPDETYLLVLDLLCDFVRERSKVRVKSTSAVPGQSRDDFGPFPPDLQKGLETVSWLRGKVADAKSRELRGWYLDLREANLSGLIRRDANLTRANLSGANLAGAELAWSDLTGSKLFGANLVGANLKRVKLAGAKLSKANLTGASLTRANLFGANLTLAKLTNARLSVTILAEANLSEADMTGVTLYGANLFRADLSGANLSGAHLSGTNLTGAKTWATWFYDESLPIDAPDDLLISLAIRNAFEPWNDFVDRIMHERPDLGWNPELKGNSPD